MAKKISSPAGPKRGQITWELCEPGWWDAMHGSIYAGWSVAQQCQVGWLDGQVQQYDPGWYCFDDALDQMIGPFPTPTGAKRSRPLS